MAEEVLYVIPKDPKEKHVAKEVGGAGVEKHTSEEGSQCGFQAASPGKDLRIMCRNRAVDMGQNILGPVGESDLVEKHENIRRNEGVVDEGRCA